MPVSLREKARAAVQSGELSESRTRCRRDHVALTGYTAEQYPRIKDARFARTLLKPVEPEEVAKVICEVLRGTQPSAA
jgi:hypothetical protein